MNLDILRNLKNNLFITIIKLRMKIKFYKSRKIKFSAFYIIGIISKRKNIRLCSITQSDKKKSIKTVPYLYIKIWYT